MGYTASNMIKDLSRNYDMIYVHTQQTDNMRNEVHLVLYTKIGIDIHTFMVMQNQAYIFSHREMMILDASCIVFVY